MTELNNRATNLDCILASIVVSRFKPLATEKPHLVNALREYLQYQTDEELERMILTGKWQIKNTNKS